MGNTTKVDKGYLKTNYSKQKSAGVGFQHNEFYHEATIGSLEIDFNALVLPTEVSAEGFSNPSPSILIGAELKNNRGNLSLRSFRGDWVDRIDYTIQSNGKITLKKPAEDGEIFYGKVHNIIRNVSENPDLQNLVAVGTLAAGQTIFNVGKQFKINANPLTQIGEIMVFRGTSPVIMLRNAGNAVANVLADGNYQEVDSNGGYGSIIEFNDVGSVGGEIVIVVATGRLLERPSDSLLQEIETLAGQLDNVIPYIEDLAGLAPGTLLAAPNNVDLKSFGDILVALNLKYNSTSSLTDYVDSKSKVKWQLKTLSASQTSTGVKSDLTFNNLQSARAYRVNISGQISSSTSEDPSGLVSWPGGTRKFSHDQNGADFVDYINVSFLIFPNASGQLTFTKSNSTGTWASGLAVIIEELPNHETTTQWT